MLEWNTLENRHRPLRRQRCLPLKEWDKPEAIAAMHERKRHRKRLMKAKCRRICRYCGRKLPKHKAELDHKIPKSRGGSDHPTNLVLCCRDCNLSKGDFTQEEWAASILRGIHPPSVKPRASGWRSLVAAVAILLPFLKGGAL